MNLSALKTVIAFFVSFILWILITPLVILNFCLLVFRILIHLLAKLFRPDLIPIYNPVDHLVIAEPSSTHPKLNISTTWVVQGKLDVQQFREHFKKTILSSEELRQRYVNLYCYFVTWGCYIFKKPVKEIKLNDRIREVFVEVNGESELEELIANYVDLNDYGENPNWEITLFQVKNSSCVNNLRVTHDKFEVDCDIKTTLVFKIHHGLCDGYSIIHLTDKLCGIETPYLVKKNEYLALEKVNIIWNTPLLCLKFVASFLCSRIIPWPQFNNEKCNKMYMSVAKLDLELFKRVRRLAGCHFATLLGVVQVESCRRTLLSIKPESILPNDVWITSPVGQPYHPFMFGGQLTNHFSYLSFRVKMRDTDLLSKLHKAEEHFLKMSHDWKLPGTLFHVLSPFTWPVPRSLLKVAQNILPDGLIKSKLGNVFSPNVRSAMEYKILGIPIERTYPHVNVGSALDFVRLQMFASSNGGNVNICVAGRKDTFSGKQEVDFVARTVVPGVLNDILQALEKRSSGQSSGYICQV